MKNIILAIVALLITVSCDKNDDTSILPPDISNVRSKALPGQILLKWDMPEDTLNIHYIQVNYYDHRLKKNVINLSSCDSLLIDKTRNKYGDYEFNLTPYSFTQTAGKTIIFKGKSGPAPVQTTVIGETKVVFNKDQLHANNQAGDNGPEKMFDKDQSTIYHSVWRGGPDILDAYVDFDLMESIMAFKINWLGRTNRAEGKVVDLDLWGSADNGETWFLIKNLTKEADNLPVTQTDWYYSPIIYAEKPFSKLRYQVKKTNKNHQFWHMSEMEIIKVELEVIDPESPDYED